MNNKKTNKIISYFYLGSILFTFLSGVFWMKSITYKTYSQDLLLIIILFFLSLLGLYTTNKAYLLLLSRNYEEKQNTELDSANQDKKKTHP